MKILQVLCGGAWGGGSAVVHDICRGLIERGDEVQVVCLDPVSEKRFGEIGAKPVWLRGWTREISPTDVVPLCDLWTLCMRERYDLVVTHTSKGGFLGRIGARLAGVPNILHHAHGYSFSQTPPGLKHNLYLWLEKLAAWAAHGAICVSEEHRQAAIDEGVEREETICTVHNGIDLEPYLSADRASARRELGFADGEFIIGGLGRLAPQKGFEELIEAMPAIVERFPEARAAIAGDGPILDDLKALANEKGVSDVVRFLGFRKDVPRVLAAFDLFAQPSHREGLSISNIEAMAAGKPIVATAIPGNREQIFHEETGLLAPAQAPAELGKAIARMIADPDLAATLGAAAQEYAKCHFDTRLMVERNLEVYDHLTSRGQSGAGWRAPRFVAVRSS